METNLYPALKPVVATSALLAEVQPPSDKKVPAVKALGGGATLPSDKAFVAQVVTARLSGTAFPENPDNIAPSERTLRPYGTPMLPSEKLTPEEDVLEPEEIIGSTTPSPEQAADKSTKADNEATPEEAAKPTDDALETDDHIT